MIINLKTSEMRRIYVKTVKRALLSTLIVLLSMVSFSATYYVSNTGNDSNSGLTTALPWKTIAKVNAQSFSPGDQFLFRRGDTWRETLTVKNSGTSSSPILISSYGTGNKPQILGSSQVTSWVDQGNNVWKSSNTLIKPYSLSTGNVFFINKDLSVGTGILKSGTSGLTDQSNWYISLQEKLHHNRWD